METTDDKALRVEVMAWIQSVDKEKKPSWYAEGWVMFCHDYQGGNVSKFEIEDVGRHVGDFLCLASDLPEDGQYPAFMVWEGTVRFSEDDVYANGQWRKANAREIMSAAAGKCPWSAS